MFCKNSIDHIIIIIISYTKCLSQASPNVRPNIGHFVKFVESWIKENSTRNDLLEDLS